MHCRKKCLLARLINLYFQILLCCKWRNLGLTKIFVKFKWELLRSKGKLFAPSVRNYLSNGMISALSSFKGSSDCACLVTAVYSHASKWIWNCSVVVFFEAKWNKWILYDFKVSPSSCGDGCLRPKEYSDKQEAEENLQDFCCGADVFSWEATFLRHTNFPLEKHIVHAIQEKRKSVIITVNYIFRIAESQGVGGYWLRKPS